MSGFGQGNNRHPQRPTTGFGSPSDSFGRPVPQAKTDNSSRLRTPAPNAEPITHGAIYDWCLAGIKGGYKPMSVGEAMTLTTVIVAAIYALGSPTTPSATLEIKAGEKTLNLTKLKKNAAHLPDTTPITIQLKDEKGKDSCHFSLPAKEFKSVLNAKSIDPVVLNALIDSMAKASNCTDSNILQIKQRLGIGQAIAGVEPRAHYSVCDVAPMGVVTPDLQTSQHRFS